MLILGDWLIDQSTLQACNHASDTTISLSKEMTALLEFMADNQHRLLSAEEILEKCWHRDSADIELVAQTIDKLTEAFGAPVINQYDGLYLLATPTYRYTYEKACLKQIKAEVEKHFTQLRNKRRLAIAAKATPTTQMKEQKSSKSSATILNGILAAVVIFLLVVVLNQ